MSITGFGRLLSIALMAALCASAQAGNTKASSIATVLEGVDLKAFLVAHADFASLHDLSAPKKNLERYTIHFSESETRLYVLFLPKFPLGWFGRGGDTPYGRTVRYEIDKTTYRIVSRAFDE